MSSTDSPGNTHNAGSSCSLVSSLFPSSCRGRAEAFARSLHRRLASLSGESNSNDETPELTETTWINSPRTIKSEPTSSNYFHPANRVQQRPCDFDPDLYFDLHATFDENQPRSPAEDSDNAELNSCVCLNEATSSEECNGRDTKQHQDAEHSESTNNEIISDSDSEVYFDPLSSSDTEKKRDCFFDPISTTDSEISTQASDRIASECQLNCEQVTVPIRISADESSESSCYSPRAIEVQLVAVPKCNSRSSTEDSTSPSHESLWSDDSTISASDSPVRINFCNQFARRISRSSSDSQIFVRVKSIKEGTKYQAEVSGSSAARMKSSSEGDVRRCIASSDKFVFKCDIGASTDIAGALKPSDFRLAGDERADPAHSDETDCAENNMLINSVNADKIVRLLEKFNGHCTDKAEKITELKDNETGQTGDKGNDGVVVEENVEDEEPRRPRIRRCSSLKSGKTPPSTPCQKKIVRFADVLGLDLADVRTFLDEIPKVPNSAYSDLIYDDMFKKDSSPVPCSFPWGVKYTETSGTDPSRGLNRTLVPLFLQPASLPTFLDTLRERFVCLENALIEDYATFCIRGTVRVLNLDFHKSVHIRYTLNSWSDYSDLQATYVPNSCDGLSDKFRFVVYCHTLGVGGKLEFAVRFHCKGAQHWDNNNGANYCFECISTKSIMDYGKSSSQDGKEWGTFY